jgi:hypothetical protein
MSARRVWTALSIVFVCLCAGDLPKPVYGGRDDALVARAVQMAKPEATRTTISSRELDFAIGIQINGCDRPLDTTFQHVTALRLRWIKQQARWADIEKSPGVYDWRCLDAVVAAAHASRVRVLFSITTAPAFRRAEFRALGQHPTSGRPTRLEDFGDFVSVLAKRYTGRIHALELWNEPNLIIEWGDTLDARNYVTLLKTGFNAAKRVDPNLLVISAGIAPSGFNTLWTHVDDKVFLEQALAAGLAQAADCIGAHANGPDGVGEIAAVAERYRSLSGAQMSICVTEFGHAIPVDGRTPPGFEWAMRHTSSTQVAAFRDGLVWARAAGYVRLVIVWNLNYDGPASDPNAPYALVRKGWTSLALDAIQQAARIP